jgi:hypothetical protein
MPAFGYTTEEGFDVSPFIDMINGGGPGRSGDVFEGGGILSALANAIATPYGSQRERRGMPPMIYDRNDPLSGVSTSAFEDLYPRSDEELQFTGGEGDTQTGGPEAGAFDSAFYTRLVPLGDEEYDLLRQLPPSLVPADLRDALPGDEVPYGATLELRGALLGDTAMRRDLPLGAGEPAAPASEIPPALLGDTDMRRETPYVAGEPPRQVPAEPSMRPLPRPRNYMGSGATPETAYVPAPPEPRPVPTLTPLEPGPSALSPAAQIMFEGTSGAYGSMVPDDMDYEYVMSEMRRAYPGMDDAYLEQMARNFGLLPNERGVTVPFAPGFR